MKIQQTDGAVVKTFTTKAEAEHYARLLRATGYKATVGTNLPNAGFKVVVRKESK